MTTTQNATRPSATARVVRALGEELAAALRVAARDAVGPTTTHFADGVADGIRTAATALGIADEVAAQAADYEAMWAAADADR